MSRFQHTDGHIIIHDLVLPYDWFITQEPNYSVLPENCIGRIYIPKKRHHLTMLKGETPCQCEGEHENHVWAEGDSYIAKYQEYAEAYLAFLNPPLTPEQKIEKDNNEICAELELIDKASIRAIRKSLIAGAPTQELVECENNAKSMRAKLK
jgi:hypothetical protein